MTTLLKAVLFSFILIWSGAVPEAYAQKKAAKRYVPQYAAIVTDAATGRVWHEENADVKVYPASLTKMMTLYMLFEALEQKKLKLSSRMKVSSLAVNQIPTKLGLRSGKTLRVQDAMMGLVTKSANDASVVIAEHLGGSVAQFAGLMTQKARSLGMNRTIFKNPSGVPDKEQITTARDMAILSRALYQRFPSYCRYFNTRNFIYNGQVHRNHNRLLGKVPGVDGIKTGYIAASGFNLAASAKRNGKRMIVVVMGGKTPDSRNARVAELLDQGFNLAAADKKQVPRVALNKVPAKSVFPAAHASNIQLKGGVARDWLIQVGVFKKAKQAHLKTQEIMKNGEIKGGKASVEVKPGRHKLFQARIINLTQGQAKQMCKSLASQGGSCLAMRNIPRPLSLASRTSNR